jgi:hypothetical protein
MRKVHKHKQAQLKTVSLYPDDLQRLNEFAKDNNIYARGVPSISGALQHILGLFFNNEAEK